MVKDSIRYLQEKTDDLSKNITTKRKRYTEDESRKLVDLVQSLGRISRLINELESAWGKDVTSFVVDYFTKVKDEKSLNDKGR